MTAKENMKRTITILITLLIVFAIITLMAFLGLEHDTSILAIDGMTPEFENWVIIILSIGSIIKIIWELYVLKRL